jgi:type 1 fimbria pilin
MTAITRFASLMTQGAAQGRDNVKNTRALLWLVFRVFRYLSVLAAAGFSGAPLAHAGCVPGDGKPRPVILLPSVSISALPSLRVGDVLGSVHVGALQDIPFVCTGAANTLEVRLTRSEAPVQDLKDVYPTSVAGVGIRVSAAGGSFAGIDDAPRPVPYKVVLTSQARHLTGFALRIDFIKTGPLQDGVLAAGPLASVMVGGTELLDVDIPAGAVIFTSSVCDAVHVGGSVAAGVGTAGSFTQESIVVQTGCNPDAAAVVQLGQPYLYGGTPIVHRPVFARASAGNPDSDWLAHAWPNAVGNNNNNSNINSTGSGVYTGSTNAFGAGNVGESALGRSARSTGFHP